MNDNWGKSSLGCFFLVLIFFILSIFIFSFLFLRACVDGILDCEALLADVPVC